MNQPSRYPVSYTHLDVYKRQLLFHLKRILANEEKNRMNLKALCIIWGPTIIAASNDDMNDVNYQILAMETLLDVADQAFEPE